MPTPRTQPKLSIADLADIYIALHHLKSAVTNQQEYDRITELEQRIKRALFSLTRAECDDPQTKSKTARTPAATPT